MTTAGFTDPYATAAMEDRCAPRIRLRIPASLRPSGDKGFSVEVKDLSLGGFSCEATTGMHQGHRCWLTLPGLSALQAEVVWNDGINVGCSFDNLINVAVLDALVARWGLVVHDS